MGKAIQAEYHKECSKIGLASAFQTTWPRHRYEDKYEELIGAPGEGLVSVIGGKYLDNGLKTLKASNKRLEQGLRISA